MVVLKVNYRKIRSNLIQGICIFTLFIFCFIFQPPKSVCFAEDINFEVTVDRVKVSLGSSIQLSLNFYGAQNISAPELPDIDGFDWRYLGPSSRMSIVNGQVSSSITHIYTLIPLKVGQFDIPSFTVDINGQQYTSKAISIEVIQGPVAATPGAQQQTMAAEGSQELEDRIFIVMQPEKKRAYVNEVIPVKIKLYINSLAIRDIQFPGFEHEGFSVDKFSDPRQYREVLGGISYDVIEFNTNVFGTRSGELRLGPANFQCNLLLKKNSTRSSRSFFGDDFFGDLFTSYERYPLNLSSAYVPVTIMDLPKEGKPANFGGALGNYNFDLQANPRKVKVGDPITLKMTISGDGNIKTVNIPSLSLGDNFKVYEPQVKQSQSSKTFEQVIIPKSENVKEIPEASFIFFNTKTGEYKTIKRGPIAIKVNPLPEGEELRLFAAPSEGTISKREVLGRNIIYIKDSPGELQKKGRFLCKNKFFVILHIFPLLGIIFVLIFQKKRERILTDVRYARRIRAPRRAKKNLEISKRLLISGEPLKFFDAAFKTLQEYLGDKLHLASASITSNVVDEQLEPRNIDKAVLGKIKECFSYCDTVRYAPSSVTKEQMQRTFSLLEDIIDQLERVKI